MTPIRRILLLAAALLGAAAIPGLGARGAQAQDPRLPAFRGIHSMVISTPTHAGAPGVPDACRLDSRALARRHAETLRAAGLAVMTWAERLGQERVNIAEVRRRFEALQRHDIEEARRREGAIVSTVGLPTLKISVVAGGVEEPGSVGRLCSAAAFATFLAPTQEWQTAVATNGAKVAADLLLWNPRPRLVIAPAAELERAVDAAIGEILAEFIATWRAQNQP